MAAGASRRSSLWFSLIASMPDVAMPLLRADAPAESIRRRCAIVQLLRRPHLRLARGAQDAFGVERGVPLREIAVVHHDGARGKDVGEVEVAIVLRAVLPF